MKYWLITSEFPPAYGGGISTYCMATAKMLKNAGHEVSVITFDYQVSELTLSKEESYTLVRFNPRKSITSEFIGYEANLSFSFAQAVKILMEREGVPDILESQEYMGIAYYLLQYKWLKYPLFKDLKVVLTLHAPSFLYLEYNKVNIFRFPYYWIGEMEKFCIKAADITISPSKYLIGEISGRMELNESAIKVIPNPYGINAALPNTESFVKGKIVFFGKLTPQKGCLEVLAYFKKMWDSGFSHPLLMIGGGNHLFHPEEMDMIDYLKKKYTNEIASGKLEFIGSLPPDKINHVIDSAHLIVIPSVVDNLPYTVFEAMSRKKVVLASKQGGQCEVIADGVDGFLFDHMVLDSFQDKVNHILSLSEEKIKAIGQKAFEKISTNYNENKIASDKIAWIQESLANQSGTNAVFPFIRKLGEAPLTISKTNESNPLLSIIIPYYNMGNYIDETIDSLFKSTYQPFEIIIVNDGSTHLKDIGALKKYEGKPEIKIIHKKNEGLSLARNEGAKAAKGHYIAFLDADDCIEPSYYTKAITVLQAYQNVSFVGCWANYFGDSSGIWITYNPEPPYILYHNSVNSSALIYKREAFLLAGLNDQKMIYGMEDYESVISLLANGFNGVVLPETLWNYRVRKNSMARLFTLDKKQYLYRLIAYKHKQFYAIFAADLVCLYNSNGPGMLYDNPTLFYELPGTGFLSGKLKQIVIEKIKSVPFLRKTALKIKRYL
jgi:glycosyltransferase involved in cell wall biosynthesis